jgi:hypothetical protein
MDLPLHVGLGNTKEPEPVSGWSSRRRCTACADKGILCAPFFWRFILCAGITHIDWSRSNSFRLAPLNPPERTNTKGNNGSAILTTNEPVYTSIARSIAPNLMGSVMDGKLRSSVFLSASRSRVVGSLSVSPCDAANRQTCPIMYFTRCAVSMVPRSSIRLRTSRTNGVVTSLTGRSPR